MKLEVGDCIERPGDPSNYIVQIVQVRPTGYTWRYLPRDTPPLAVPLTVGVQYESDITDDPFFDRGWQLVQRTGADDRRR